jgi:hypothetical protein
MEKKEPIPVKYFSFAEVISGLQEGKVFTRWHDGSCITKQIPANIDSEMIPKMQSLCPKAKELLSMKKGIYYKNQVLMLKPLGDKVMATYYMPTWEDIFANDWVDL